MIARPDPIYGVTTQNLYDGKDIIAEISSGAVGDSYLRSLRVDEPFVRQTSATKEFYHTDALGSTLALSSATGTVAASYNYEAFGKTTFAGTSTNPFQYTGRENDGTGLYHYRGRYYSPQLQRFVSEDPILVPFTPLSVGACPKSNKTIWVLPQRVAFPGSDTSQILNQFGYVNNSPIQFVDPSGLTKCKLEDVTAKCSLDFGLRGQRDSPEAFTLAQCAGAQYEQFGIFCGGNKACLATQALTVFRICGDAKDPDNKKDALVKCTKDILACLSE